MDIAVEIGSYKSCLELTSCHLRLHNIQIFGFGKSSARKEEGSPSTKEILKGKSLSTESGHLVELIQSGPLPRALNLEGTGHRAPPSAFIKRLPACILQHVPTAQASLVPICALCLMFLGALCYPPAN